MKPFGVLHPLFVHFPLALVVTAAIFEWRAWRRDRTLPSPHLSPLLGIAACGALAAVATGWLQASGRTGSDSLLAAIERHRWFGVAAAVLITGTWWLSRGEPREGRLLATRGALILATLSVGIGGHFGAELTHGRDTYLNALDDLLGRDPESRDRKFKNARARLTWARERLSEWTPPPADSPVDYARDIQPIFAGQCLPCHGPEKMVGGLRLDTRRVAFEGGDRGPAIVPGDHGKSALWFRSIEAKPDRPRMPKDEPPLPEEWLETIARWIDEGAPWPEPEPTPWTRTEN